ncbi:hypothetical protein BTN50_0795 [Candidatus Enterovibrio altilux]|uniref:Uncharacterized protein n=1 Tax=Candidatus Enterovibrio altilux TaxID=1927128 RepID=A0A291B8H0_9GAMM|nr:hypothetical protein BTN50_0795 [Candidatus Enterovibrio luxaltus]
MKSNSQLPKIIRFKSVLMFKIKKLLEKNIEPKALKYPN